MYCELSNGQIPFVYLPISPPHFNFDNQPKSKAKFDWHKDYKVSKISEQNRKKQNINTIRWIASCGPCWELTNQFDSQSIHTKIPNNGLFILKILKVTVFLKICARHKQLHWRRAKSFNDGLIRADAADSKNLRRVFYSSLCSCYKNVIFYMHVYELSWRYKTNTCSQGPVISSQICGSIANAW